MLYFKMSCEEARLMGDFGQVLGEELSLLWGLEGVVEEKQIEFRESK